MKFVIDSTFEGLDRSKGITKNEIAEANEKINKVVFWIHDVY